MAAQGSPRNLRGFGRCERLFRRRFQEPAANVDSLSQEISQVEQRRRRKGERKVEARIQTARGARSLAAARSDALKHNSTADDHKTTKQERVLTLLSRADGASIHEIMQATQWQQHSVRGFLAGTVKKKLGFTLTSAKAKDGSRRYRIDPKRNR